MRQLRLVGLAEDGASVVLATPGGDEYRLPVDERLRAACRGDLTRLGQIEIEMESPLRPREIQSRVRAGESAEEIAESCGMPLDRVLRFAYPVLQERQRVVAQARAVTLRPRDPTTLGELVEERLISRGTDPGTLRWDAWRREDGRWTVRLSWRHAAEHSASWAFQLAGRALRPDDPAAEQLSAEEFHARTITAVTPLAAATPVASPRPGPHGSAGGAEPRTTPPPGSPGSRPTAGSPASRPTAGSPASPPGVGPAPGRPTAGGSTASVGPRPDTPDPGTAQAIPGGSGAGGSGASSPAPGERASGGSSASRSALGERAASGSGTSRPTPSGSRSRSSGARLASGSAQSGSGPSRSAGRPAGGGRTPEPAGDPDDGEVEQPRRVAAAGGGEAVLETPDEERARRASVPSWDDILLGVRRRH